MQRKHYIIFALILLVYIANLFIDVMAEDAAQYAEMSWEMLTTKSFIQVHCLGKDYLDKPPLLFWLNSLSFYIFGIGTVSYKLPSLLFAILGIYSTYRFARLYYPQPTAITAAIMLASTQALFLITNDVRTDTILMGSVIFAIWQWAAYIETDGWANLLGGSLGLGLALLDKGPIGMIAVGASLLPHLIITGRWRGIFNLRLVPAVAIIALMLLPMCIGLYEQFGMQGLRFYFWTQSFGRITGESIWNNHPDTFFLIHTTAWAFMPWTLFLFWGWIASLISFAKSRLTAAGMREIISLSGFTLVLIALMLSKYQLPHYIFVVYPLAAVMAADRYHRLDTRSLFGKILSVLQVVILIAIIVVASLLQYCFKGADIPSLLCLSVLFPLAIVAALWANGPIKNTRTIRLYTIENIKQFLGKSKLNPEAVLAFDLLYRNILMLSLAVILSFNFMLSVFYFPAIMKYQPGSDIGRYVKDLVSIDNHYVSYQYGLEYANIFYAQNMSAMNTWDINEFKQLLNLKKKLLVITTPAGMDDLRKNNVKIKVIEDRDSYKVSTLKAEFLNPSTRQAVCSKVYLLEAYTPQP